MNIKRDNDGEPIETSKYLTIEVAYDSLEFLNPIGDEDHTGMVISEFERFLKMSALDLGLTNFKVEASEK